MAENFLCISIIVGLVLFIANHAKRTKAAIRPKPKAYDRTVYKPRKRENKDLPDGNFTHEHVESMWDEIE